MKKNVKEAFYNSMPIIRIAPVCNGKIYVVPRHSKGMEDYQFDIPIHEFVDAPPAPSEKTVQRLKERYQKHIQTNEQPRFSVKYKLKSTGQDTVYLYILPLQKEEDIHFCQGKFIAAEEIQAAKHPYSPHLQEESELLGMAAELWNDFYTT